MCQLSDCLCNYVALQVVSGAEKVKITRWEHAVEPWLASCYAMTQLFCLIAYGVLT